MVTGGQFVISGANAGKSAVWGYKVVLWKIAEKSGAVSGHRFSDASGSPKSGPF